MKRNKHRELSYRSQMQSDLRGLEEAFGAASIEALEKRARNQGQEEYAEFLAKEKKRETRRKSD
jgi:Fic family protein